jgi:hypothetical protein
MRRYAPWHQPYEIRGLEQRLADQITEYDRAAARGISVRLLPKKGRPPLAAR